MKCFNLIALSIVGMLFVLCTADGISQSIDQMENSPIGYIEEEAYLLNTQTIHTLSTQDLYNLAHFHSNNFYPTIDFRYSEHSRFTIYDTDEKLTFSSPQAFELRVGFNTLNYSLNDIGLLSFSPYLNYSIFTPNSDYVDSAFPHVIKSHQLGLGYEFTTKTKLFGRELLLLNSHTFSWGHFQLSELHTNNFQSKRDIFHEKIKYGNAYEAGFRYVSSIGVSFTTTYEINHFLPAFMTSSILGSTIIEDATKLTSLLITKYISDYFIPYKYKLASLFFVNTGLNFLFHTLRKKKMNWPFSNEPPLALERIKFGLSYTFK